MPLENYGVFKGYAVNRLPCRTGLSPYYHMHVSDGKNEFRVQITVKSEAYPSNIRYRVIDNFNHPLTSRLGRYKMGFTNLDKTPSSGAIDYIRLNPFKMDELIKLPQGRIGPGGGFNNIMDNCVLSAMEDKDALVYVFGEIHGPGETKDRFFGFDPSKTIQNVHQNQGSYVKWSRENGVWQDGALFFYYPKDNLWTAVFVVFQSQSRHTDDATGFPIGPEPLPIPESYDDPEIPDIPEVYIMGATLHFDGNKPVEQKVTLLNVTDKPVDLDGFSIADLLMNKEVITKTIIKPGQFLTIKLSGNSTVLSSLGGIITLLDNRGLKVHGVYYNREDIKQKRWTLRF
ncbi:DUF2278 family protein [bacterium]|nr:DUF2278 family protein [bacterium]